VPARRVGKLVDLERDQMMGHEIAHSLEPETGELRQHLALVWNSRAEHVIKRRNAIGRHDEQSRLARRQRDVVDVADFASSIERETFK